MGIGWAGLSTNAVATTLAPWFDKHRGRAVSIASLASCAIQLATALGPSLYSVLHDAFGSYNPVLIGAAGLDIAAAAIAIAGHRKPAALFA
jgi:MFS family permease